MTTERLWKPKRGRQRLLLRWMLSQWCNYACMYCRQDHTRKQTFEGSPGHFADNAPVERWLGALNAAFSSYNATVTLTGGETMLDAKAVRPLLVGLADATWCERVRIDTNGSWDPTRFDSMPRGKFTLMVSYHPTEVPYEAFLSQLDGLIASGWHVSMVTLVVTPSRVPLLHALADALWARRVPLSAMPAFGELSFFTPKEAAELKRHVPGLDWGTRSGRELTRGRSCLYPAVAYEMKPDGSLEVACHPHLRGSLFSLPLPELHKSYVPCPHQRCSCVDRYTFLGDLDADNSVSPTDGYTSRMKSLRLV